MIVHRSNRLERLVDRLAIAIDRPLRDPIAPEHVVVPSRAVAQWLAVELARRRGVSAHVAFRRPREVVDHVLGAVLGDDPALPAAWSRERVAWTLMGLLPQVIDQAAFAPLRVWLRPRRGQDRRSPDHDVDEAVARRWQLAVRIAHTFDRYAIFRAETVCAWSNGEDAGPLEVGDAWQPVLWRALEAALGPHHVAARHARFVEADRIVRPDALPERLLVFGATTLPPLHLDVLDRLSRHVEVRLFQLSPSRARWARAPLDEQQPLLASLGRVGRDLEAALEALPHAEDDEDLFELPRGECALEVLQRDAFELRSRLPGARARLAATDTSLQVLGCHSPARELEVLRDALWERLHADPTLRPRDVLVLLPDVATYGPLVDAVFGVPPEDPLHLPYAVADRPVGRGDDVARALLDLLALVGSRLEAPAVVDLLSHAPIRRRFGIEESDVAVVEQLVARAGIRWGRDAAHRGRFGQPPVDTNTWQRGVERLLLGRAPGSRSSAAGDEPPTEGATGELVGRIADFVAFVLAAIDDLERPRPTAVWLARLDALIVEAFAPSPGDDEPGGARLREGIAALRDEVLASGFDEAVPLRVVRSLVEARLLGAKRGGAFLREGITFCEMSPTRSIPARVVALVGMSDEAFPRADARLGFDLVPRHPRPGDRSRRDDDRQLVLEALLSARDALIVTYVSRSVQDNKPRPPSVVLADVLDAVDQTFEAPGHTLARAAIVVDHPLQPFSVRYVTEPLPGERALHTWDGVAAAGARALTSGTAPTAPFLTGAIPPPAPIAEVDLGALTRFLSDPVCWFYERRLGIGRHDASEPLSAREPVEVGARDEHGLGERMLELRRASLGWDEVRAVLEGEGRLPLGHLANPVLARLARRVEDVLASARSRLAEAALPPVDVDVALEGVRLTGRLGDLREGARVRVGYADVGPGTPRRLALWVSHLALQLAGDAVPRASELYGRLGDRAGWIGFAPVPPDEARAALASLVAVFVEGQATPLPFLPVAGWAWIDAIAGGSRGDDALRKARQAAGTLWRVDDRGREAWSRLLGGEAAFDPDDGAQPSRFEQLAERVLRPLHRHGGRR